MRILLVRDTRLIVTSTRIQKMAQTLEELKAENAKAEEKVQEKTETPVTETEEEAAEEEELETEEQAAESDEEESEETEVESWMLTEEQTSEGDDAKFTGGDIAAAKRKLKAKLGKKDDEVEALKAEIERLKNGSSKPQPAAINPSESEMPMEEDYEFDKVKYKAAMTAWVTSKVNAGNAASNQASQQTQTQAENKRVLDSKVDEHYQRAAILIKESGIDEEKYQNADLVVRQAVESVLPQNGDQITDYLISKLGKGSEKVIYFLGNNAAKRAEFVETFRSDPNGIDAAIMLGELKKDVTAPKKRVSKAPAPASQAKGESGSETASKLKKQYEKAGDDVQTRIDLKRKAKAQGHDVSTW